VINDDRLVLGDGGKMRLDIDPFPVNVVDYGERKILVWIDQADTTRGKNAIVSDELRNRMIKPRSLEVGVWKENTLKRPRRRVRPTSDMLMHKYVRQWQERARARVSEVKRPRSPCYGQKQWFRYDLRATAWQGPENMQAWPRVRARDARLFYGRARGSRRELSGRLLEDRRDGDVVMIGSVPCKLQYEIYVGDHRVIKAGLARMS
jgi:hypothetical protein